MKTAHHITAVFLVLITFSTAAATNDSWIKEAYSHSFHYEQTERYENAIKSLSSVVKAYPKGYTVNLRLGWLYYLVGRYSNSMAHYQVASKSAPGAIEPTLGLLLPQLAQERYAEAEQTAYRIIATDYYNYYANLHLSFALRKQKKSGLALKVVNKMLVKYPTNVAFLVELGMLYMELGEGEKAAEVFTTVTILDPENVTAKNQLTK